MSQTKKLSSVPAISSLAEGDKLAVVTEAGATALVSKDTLKAEMGLNSRGCYLDPLEEQWIRVAKLGSVASIGIVYVTNYYYVLTASPAIIKVGSSHDKASAFVTALVAKTSPYKKVRLVQTAWNGEFYVDLMLNSSTGRNDFRAFATGINIEALAPSIAPSVDDARWVIESTPVVGGG